ncbi:DNA damage-binding protein CMR1 isoform X2 [Eutrema salsugineum]|uniref:DNA damage-binding protein CMR1 isoform X2 n=1 Tax=Eutrema salsugineum TaxID=72664 RepID=UPI000CED32BA|nr:DNA damage-binding protein CMR1 isoform X2 [Eutrema salsugineum]
MATEYERKRLENIRRNDEMMVALNVRAKASLLSAATKRPRDESKSFQKKKKKPTKSETPIVIRKSLRTRGLNPDSGGLPDGFSDYPNRMAPPPPPDKSSSRLLAPLPFDAAYGGDDSHKNFVETILGIARKSMVNGEIGTVKVSKDDPPLVPRHCGTRSSSRLSNASVKKEEPVFAIKSCGGKLVKGETGSVKDENESPMVNTRSSARLSNVVAKKEEPDSSIDYVKKEVFEVGFPVKPEEIEFGGGFDTGSLSLEPHNVARVVPGRILVVKFLPCENVKLIAAGDKLGHVGFWNLDCQDEEDDGIYLFHPHSAPVSSLVFQQNSFSKRPNDEQSLYFCEGYGMLNIWDLRAGKSLFQWDLHDHRINSIDFNPQNPHVMATSSTDGTACLWDLRSMGAKKPKTLTTVNHARAVHSAYFSPSGLSLATTSVDNHLGILSGANFEDTSMIYHDNITNRWISTFRGVWGWDDSYVFVANRSKGIDVISPKLKRTVKELQNPLMRAIPCRIHCHPLNVGMLAGATAGGQVYVWTTK